MKKFLIKVLKFSVFSICVCIFLYLFMTAAYLYRLNNLRLDPKINTLVIGDSQSQTAIDDSLYTNVINFSNNSEHYLLTYNVLKLLTKNNPQIKNVILGCSFHNFSSFYERCLFNEDNKAEPISRMLCSRYFSMLDIDGKLLLIDNNPTQIIKSFRAIVVSMIVPFTENYSKYRDYQFIGGYYPGLKRVLNDTLIRETISWHFYTDSTGTEQEHFSNLQLKYLKDIIKLCKEKNIRLVLLNTPLHENCFKLIPEKFISDYYSTLKDLEDKDNIILFDYPEYKLPDDDFGDGNHLNKKGASVFTPEVMNRLNSN